MDKTSKHNEHCLESDKGDIEQIAAEKLHRLSKDHSKGMLSFETYRQERMRLLESFNLALQEGVDVSGPDLISEKPSPSLTAVASSCEKSDRIEVEMSLARSLFMFISAFSSGALLGYAVLYFS